MNAITAIVAGICIIALLFAILCLNGWILMSLWNWIAPLFWYVAPHLTFWQGVGLVALLSTIGGLFRASFTSPKK